MPRVRFGKIHILNSYFNSSVSNKCIAAGVQANIRVDGNVFENVKEPINLMSGYTAVTVTSNNTFTNVTGNKTEAELHLRHHILFLLCRFLQ